MATAESVKAKINSLINKANSVTGKSDTNITSGVKSLIEGYGKDNIEAYDESVTVDEGASVVFDEDYAEGKADGIDEGIAEGIEQGKEEAYDAFWDAFQDNGARSNYENAFRNVCWTDKCYNPKYPINTDRIGWMFMGCKLTDTKVPITHKGQTNATYVFYDALTMVTIRSLTVDENTTYSSWFTRAEALENITFEGVIGSDIDMHWSTKLTNASLRSIITHISASTSGFAVSLSNTAVNKAFETSVGANDGSTSEEWLALIATKNNWTISLN